LPEGPVKVDKVYGVSGSWPEYHDLECLTRSPAPCRVRVDALPEDLVYRERVYGARGPSTITWTEQPYHRARSGVVLLSPQRTLLIRAAGSLVFRGCPNTITWLSQRVLRPRAGVALIRSQRTTLGHATSVMFVTVSPNIVTCCSKTILRPRAGVASKRSQRTLWNNVTLHFVRPAPSCRLCLRRRKSGASEISLDPAPRGSADGASQATPPCHGRALQKSMGRR
jgi:hypothetical protein